MIYVFRTSVITELQVKKLQLDRLSTDLNWNFDFEDCDNILRIVSSSLKPTKIIEHLHLNGFECVELE